MEKEKGLDSLTNNPVVVKIGEDDITVHEVTMRSFKAFVAACAPFLSEFDEAGRLAERVDTATGEKKPAEDYALFRVLADHADAFMRAAELVTNKPVSYYQRLTPDKFFDVAAAIIQVNGNFFIGRLAPSVLRMGAALGSIGSTASKH